MRFSLFISKIQSFRAYRIPFPLDFSFSSSFRFFFFFFPFLRRLSRTISIPKHPFQIPRPFCNSLHPTVHPSFSSWEKYPACDARAKSGEGRATVSVCISGQRNTSCVYPEGISGKRGCRERPYVMWDALPYPPPLSSNQNAAASDLRKNAEEGTKKKTTNERKKGKVIRKPPSQNESFPFLLSFFFEFSGRKDER